MVLASGLWWGCSPEVVPGLLSSQGWGTFAYKLIMEGCWQEASGACLPVISIGCSYCAAGFPQREDGGGTPCQLWSCLWLIHSLLILPIRSESLSPAHIQPTEGGYTRAWMSRGHLRVWLLQPPFQDTNFVSYPVTQEILKICLNYFHYRNFSSPSIHLQQSFVDLSQPKYRRPVEGLIQNFISTTTTIHCDGELQVSVGRKQNHSAELQEINVLASVQFPLDTCPCHRKKY